MRTVSDWTHLSRTPLLLVPHIKFQLLLYCWHLPPRALEVSTTLLVQSRWRCALLGWALTRSYLYLSLIPPACHSSCLLSPLSISTICRIDPKQRLMCCHLPCPKGWVSLVRTCSVQKQWSFWGWISTAIELRKYCYGWEGRAASGSCLSHVGSIWSTHPMFSASWPCTVLLCWVLGWFVLHKVAVS